MLLQIELSPLELYSHIFKTHFYFSCKRKQKKKRKRKESNLTPPEHQIRLVTSN